MFLQFEYNDGNAAISNFDTDTTSYGIQIPSNVTTVKLSQITTSSSSANVTSITYGNSNTPYVEGSLINLPVKGGAELTFTIIVTAGNGASRPYSVGFSNPSNPVIWMGTAEFDGPHGNKQIRSVEVEIAGVQSATSDVVEGGWSVSIDELLRPVNFVVVMKENKGIAPSEDWVTYRESFPVGDAQAGVSIRLVVNTSSVARMIYNATDFIAIGRDENKTENWFLANDIDLPDSASGWVGPNDYSGHFYGNGHAINNLDFGDSIDGDRGLFKTLADGAEIRDLIITIKEHATPVPITRKTRTGAIVSYVDASGNMTFSNVTVNGTLRLGNATDNYLLIGGFIGELKGNPLANVRIEKCVSNLNIVHNIVTESALGTGCAYGGFIGSANGMLNMANCYSTGSLNITIPKDAALAVGGLIGWIEKDVVVVQNCYSTSEIITSKTINTSTNRFYTGGLVGAMGGRFGSDLAGTLKNSIALNTRINATQTGSMGERSALGRVTGYKGIGILSDNLALGSMTINKASIVNSRTGIDGGTISSEDLRLEATWTGLGFSNTIWDFSQLSTGYPKLR
jgi:hypothetical protein